MNILKWMRKDGIRTTKQRADTPTPRHYTARVNAVDSEWCSGWWPDDSGFYETRRHVGQSAERFNAGVEVSHRVYDGMVWGEAHLTPEKARKAADEMERGRREEIEPCPEIGVASARGRALGGGQ